MLSSNQTKTLEFNKLLLVLVVRYLEMFRVIQFNKIQMKSWRTLDFLKDVHRSNLSVVQYEIEILLLVLSYLKNSTMKPPHLDESSHSLLLVMIHSSSLSWRLICLTKFLGSSCPHYRFNKC